MPMRSHLYLLLLAFLLPVRPLRADEPVLPPGVGILDKIPAAGQIPPGVSVYALEVDWTDPMLAPPRIELGLESSGGPPALWGKIAPDALKIQLVEPEETDGGWELPLEVQIPTGEAEEPARGRTAIDPAPAESAPVAPDRDQLRVGGICPWFFLGPTAAMDPDPPSPLIEGSASVGVRWLGHPGDWERHPAELDLKDQWLMSSLDPVSRRTTFFLVVNKTGKEIKRENLNSWIKAAFPRPQVWLAIHSIGPRVAVGMKDWRLGETKLDRAPTSGKVERAGALLILEKIKPGKPVDWTRIGQPVITTSATQPGYTEQAAISGPIWPLPLRPPVWMSGENPAGPDATPWFEIRLPQARPVRMIRLIHASAAGWSEQFNPAVLQLTLKEEDQSPFAEPIQIKKIVSDTTSIRFGDERKIQSVRIEFIRTTTIGPANIPARLARLQLIGPLEE
ncbi:hypothetical protein HY256_11115 [Candidatus Sumerlaeota bacterium]|nr:hypothetical protein [Candidatus Sumerlaeota bacterium]